LRTRELSSSNLKVSYCSSQGPTQVELLSLHSSCCPGGVPASKIGFGRVPARSGVTALALALPGLCSPKRASNSGICTRAKPAAFLKRSALGLWECSPLCRSKTCRHPLALPQRFHSRPVSPTHPEKTKIELLLLCPNSFAIGGNAGSSLAHCPLGGTGQITPCAARSRSRTST
jgi:hypothetical protein